VTAPDRAGEGVGSREGGWTFVTKVAQELPSCDFLVSNAPLPWRDDGGLALLGGFVAACRSSEDATLPVRGPARGCLRRQVRRLAERT